MCEGFREVVDIFISFPKHASSAYYGPGDIVRAGDTTLKTEKGPEKGLYMRERERTM